jgi:3-oxoacyl-[acyl-carrier protein] reductase
MDLGLKGKKALVCASSKGLGFGAALSLAKEGADVFLCARNEDALAEAAEKIAQKTGQKPAFSKTDLVDRKQREQLFQAAFEALGAIDILVPNAGGPPPGPFESHGHENWQLALDLALHPITHLTALVLPGMRERRFGRIVQIVSIAALEVIDDLILSNASRPAVLGFAKALAREVAPDGILVNSICPGIFLTHRIHQLAVSRAKELGVTKERFLDKLAGDIPLGRPGNPEELGDLAAFLASPKNTYITGASITIDGGKTRRLY